jgi:hypothetical protein
MYAGGHARFAVLINLLADCWRCPRTHTNVLLICTHRWEGDAILIVKGRSCILKCEEGKQLSASNTQKKSEMDTLKEGETLFFGGKEITIEGPIKPEDYQSGKCFLKGQCTAPALPQRNASATFSVLSAGFRAPLSARAKEAGVLKPRPVRHATVFGPFIF